MRISNIINSENISDKGKLRVIGGRKADESRIIGMVRLPKIDIMNYINRVTKRRYLCNDKLIFWQAGFSNFRRKIARLAKTPTITIFLNCFQSV